VKDVTFFFFYITGVLLRFLIFAIPLNFGGSLTSRTLVFK
jgi:hypothetical protein